MKQRPKILLDQVRYAIRLKHYPIRIEEAYVACIKSHRQEQLGTPRTLPGAFLKACLRFSNVRPLNLFRATALMIGTLRETAIDAFTVQEAQERGGLDQSWL